VRRSRGFPRLMTSDSPLHPIPRGSRSRRGALAPTQTGGPASLTPRATASPASLATASPAGLTPRAMASPASLATASPAGLTRPAMASPASLATASPAGLTPRAMASPASLATASPASPARTETGGRVDPAPPGSRRHLGLRDAGCRAPIRMKT
jgi:serine/threonine-protein kinase